VAAEYCASSATEIDPVALPMHLVLEIAMPDNPSSDLGDARDPGNDRHTSGLGPVFREQVGKLADRSKDAGVDTAHAVGKAAETAAQELDRATPELANYVRNAATYTHRLADDLDRRSASELLSEAVAWGREQPLMALAGAAILGFALSRIIRSGVETDLEGGS
jgi:hypothetical protein